MDSETRHAKRLIEVDLPIREISEHARKDKGRRKGHLHRMHIWWATRPLASCRAVTLAALLPDPVDANCPKSFRVEARRALSAFTRKDLADAVVLRQSLLDFVSNFAAWDNGPNAAYVSTARKLVAAAHPDGPPLVFDPFAGAGSIPFEVRRLGAQSFAGDINPVAVLINKISQEYLPKYRQNLVEAVQEWGVWLLERVRHELSPFYPCDSSGAMPLAYIWARTVRCEGPGCGAELPLLGMLWLSRKEDNRAALRYRGDSQSKRVHVEIFKPKSAADLQSPISRRFAATCPICDYTTPYKRVREQVRARLGGTHDARLLAVIMLHSSGARTFREATDRDREVAQEGAMRLEAAIQGKRGLSVVPDEPYPDWYSGVFNPGLWNVPTWGDLFTRRQALALTMFVDAVKDVGEEIVGRSEDKAFADAVCTCLAMVVSNMSHYLSSVSIYALDHMISAFVQGSGMAMRPDFAEANPLMPRLVGGFEYALGQMTSVLQREVGQAAQPGTVQQVSATHVPLPDDSLAYLVTDPPYYAAVPYSDLSDFCYVWLKRMLGEIHPDLFRTELTPKDDELVAYYVQPTKRRKKDAAFFEEKMQEALRDCRRVLRPGGVAVVIFAHKGTSGWEALLSALIGAGWTVTASWPIDTERAARMRAKNSAVLGSSVHLVCRPRERADGSLLEEVGDWGVVLRQLPKRIHEWMPRLAREGIVGADAIFSCLGPALEIFSRYSRVERVSGEQVELREYLEQVWAAVAREALSMIFEDADATGLEADARLTAMWLWTLSTSAPGGEGVGRRSNAGSAGSEDVQGGTRKVNATFSLEFDAARKIAQGLGAHLDDLGRIVEIKGDRARLVSVAERTRQLFGTDPTQSGQPRRTKKTKQLTLFEELEAAERGADWGDIGLPPLGDTTLDRVHQTMVLFAAGRTQALKRFLVEEGVGRHATFWQLAQSLSALYPNGTDEKRWVDGVLARKKGLGF